MPNRSDRRPTDTAENPGAPRHAGGPALTVAGTATTATALAAAGAPWWATTVVVAGGTLLAAVQAVFPQESGHRLEWWRDRRRYGFSRRSATRPDRPEGRPSAVSGRPGPLG